ncbi:type II toxin-antitoxin system PemK/MazF family toxin [Asaia sp. As-1742]|uniref:type II toxin-antitoxin system PemK/MazF family toxin n=1 Tax=Asaia sp. As-1742 TaxID=2608325 RepID=UPI00141DECC1|nr:type II toxin-antitoxin system PemK/MazF family toxin [Asaia sp. As-1742]NIE81680.1 type II toxin-antitoxin system PemK/MazF family toxin [Asaia sp. As-1742]
MVCPALIEPSDRFGARTAITVLPLSNVIVEAPLLRLAVEPSARNGLRRKLLIIVDKPVAIGRDKIGPAFENADDTLMLSVSQAMALFLGLA